MDNGIVTQVRQIAADLFEEPIANITLESSPQTLQNWDSLQHLNLTLALEETFGIQISPEEAESLKDVAAVVSLVQQRVGR